MTQLLEKAFAKATTELNEAEQDSLAKLLIERMDDLLDEAQWVASFASSQDALAKLAEEAEQEMDEGITEPLDDLLK